MLPSRKDKENIFWIFTDGSSFIKKKYYESSSACIIYLNDEFITKFGCFHENGTNSLGELYAVMMGLDKVYEILNNSDTLTQANTEIKVVSDSQYVVKSLTSYIYTWVKQGMDKNWKASTGKPVAYQDLMKYVFAKYLIKPEYTTSIFHIMGHVGSKILVNKAFFKFNEYNNSYLTISEFKIMMKRNNMVDELANYIRTNKCYYYEKVGDSEWVKNPRKNLTRNGKTLIRKRR